MLHSTFHVAMLYVLLVSNFYNSSFFFFFDNKGYLPPILAQEPLALSPRDTHFYNISLIIKLIANLVKDFDVAI